MRCEMTVLHCSYVITERRRERRLQLGSDFNVITGPDIERRGGPRLELEHTMVYS